MRYIDCPQTKCLQIEIHCRAALAQTRGSNLILLETFMSNVTFTRIDAKGPGATGLQPALHDPADVILDGAKAPHALTAFSDADNVLTAGVWQCDAGTLKLSDLPIHEVCVLIEGEVEITGDDGRREVYRAGDAFVLHKGFSGTWHMPVATKKYSIVYCG
ncbi:MAG TPA: cupin domain-containing protein [Paraburkholderia sp.]|nr:cupin domain-containing protein [Paraburkholderia sp.]